MKVLIFSDNHGNIDIIDKAISSFNPDFIYGLGDFEVSEYELLSRNIFGVKGNSYFDPDYPVDRIFSLEGFNILLTHGHTHNVRSSLLGLSLFSKENNIDLAFYGHTHIANIECKDNITFINPGSISRPYSPTFPTIALMDIKKGSAYIKIIDILTNNIYKEIVINK